VYVIVVVFIREKKTIEIDPLFQLHLLEDMRLRKFDNYARIIQKAMKRFCAVRVYQRQREQGKSIEFDH